MPTHSNAVDLKLDVGTSWYSLASLLGLSTDRFSWLPPVAASFTFRSAHDAAMDSIDNENAPSCSPKKALIMILICLMLVVLSFGASSFGLPLYVALNESHGMNTSLFLVAVAFSAI